ncbi:MAG: hypothetical protein EPN45_06175 [Rhizobiaceae bacterium]|nr:MAG: hypothetical protein EPN45_06175 [Rhizobiaceae bacterium]
MVGFTLTSEQIRSAPPQVRLWLEHEIALSLSPAMRDPGLSSSWEHLVACTSQQAAAIYSEIRNMLPVTNVFFEFGREGASIEQDGLEAFRTDNVIRNTHLQGVSQFGVCLEIINRALRQIYGDAAATLYLLDPKGYCIIASQTRNSIRAVWREVIASHQLLIGGGGGMENSTGQAILPFSTISSAVPSASVHLGKNFPTTRDEAATATGPEPKGQDQPD